MSLLASKQIQKMIAGSLYVTGFSYPAAATANVSAALATAATGAGYAGANVPVQNAVISTASGTPGFIVTGNNRVEIYSGADGGKLTDANGNEVYGRLTAVGAVYSLALFSMVAGTQTSYVPAAAVTIDFAPQYLYTFELLPHDFATGQDARYIGDDPASVGARTNEEIIAVTAANTLAALTQTYTSGPARLIVNGQSISSLSGAFTISGTTVTWVAATAGYSLATTDQVIAIYPY